MNKSWIGQKMSIDLRRGRRVERAWDCECYVRWMKMWMSERLGKRW